MSLKNTEKCLIQHAAFYYILLKSFSLFCKERHTRAQNGLTLRYIIIA